MRSTLSLVQKHEEVSTKDRREKLMLRHVPLDEDFLFKDELWVSDVETEDSLRILREDELRQNGK